MATYQVNLDALHGLSGQFATISHTLEDIKGAVSSPTGAYGSSDLEQEVGSFIDGWTDGRKKICDGVKGLGARVDAAVDAYSKAETNVQHAAHMETRP
ncbi:MAG: hypothetical protein M3137_06205 [Actinomycetota bacterium]|nr:hypothetical protein [Actinomycetota bacterium]